MSLHLSTLRLGKTAEIADELKDAPASSTTTASGISIGMDDFSDLKTSVNCLTTVKTSHQSQPTIRWFYHR